MNGEYETQESLILNHLQTEGDITSIQAIMMYGVTRLAAVICKQKKKGYAIESVDEVGFNRNGRKVTYARYILRNKAA